MLAAAAATLSGEGMTEIILPIDDNTGADVRRRLGSGFTRRSVVISGTLNIGDEPAYIASCLTVVKRGMNDADADIVCDAGAEEMVVLVVVVVVVVCVKYVTD